MTVHALMSMSVHLVGIIARQESHVSTYLVVLLASVSYSSTKCTALYRILSFTQHHFDSAVLYSLYIIEDQFPLNSFLQPFQEQHLLQLSKEILTSASSMEMKNPSVLISTMRMERCLILFPIWKRVWRSMDSSFLIWVTAKHFNSKNLIVTSVFYFIKHFHINFQFIITGDPSGSQSKETCLSS